MKMKKFLALSLVFIMSISCISCGETQEQTETVEPKVTQMRAICELATMECYYHNVAKYKEEDAEGHLWWKKDKHFWVEYSGIVKIGVDMSLVNMELENDTVKITIPEAKVLSSKVDETSLNEDSFIKEAKSADIDAEDQTKAFKEAQDNMVKEASNDTTLLADAQQRAQILMEDYVKNIGDAVGKEYTIEWIMVDSQGNAVGNSAQTSQEEETQEDTTQEE